MTYPPPALAAPVDLTRTRTLPRHFAWVDPRLRERLRALSLEEILRLFFLHLAADKTGCSFWADRTLAKRLGLRAGDVAHARGGLGTKGLIAYRDPLYQLLPVAARP